MPRHRKKTAMAATMMMPKIEEVEEVDAEMGFARIPDDREALLAFMDERAKKIQRLKDHITVYERKLSDEEKLMRDAESKFLCLDRLQSDNDIAPLNKSSSDSAKTSSAGSTSSESESGSLSKSKVSSETGSLLGIKEFWTKDIGVRTMHETSSSRLRSETSKKPFIMLPPPLKRKLSVPERPEENVTKGQPAPGNEFVVKDDDRGSCQKDNVTPEAKRSCSIETQGRDSHTGKTFAKPRMSASSNISRQVLQQQSEFQGHDELITLIGRSSLPSTIQSRTESMLPSCHSKRLRSLSLSPSNHKLFATSALDGAVNFWQLRSDGSTACLLKTVNSIGPDQKKWAEDIAWHPHETALFSVYTSDDGHPQISVLHLNEANKVKAKSCKSAFMEDKPHTKGLINRIMFTPWNDPRFITGGSDHAVVLWNERRENVWKSTLLHRDVHTSSVMGVAGMRHNNLVVSCGEDRRFVGYDVQEEKLRFKHKVDSKCTNVLPNPRDFNLVMVHTRQLDRQMRLYDIRLPNTELFSFGWKQQSSESQSALINQSWSPDGLYISSGSADPVIHIFDIRYNAPNPSHSINAHKKRVFKAEWHASLPLLISISSDTFIGLHKLC
ncbi:PREDICTED: protein tipD isoform X2 [Tarenaya hassleriana]|uniref:protein tipD isoform X2 n=1 Tax=Tarenaya hassleriana TaxID=28532 RepID=UPI00053C67F2|nr:PREDICTED: protein tipD isoform X2 [Tarenaya hassleriana]